MVMIYMAAGCYSLSSHGSFKNPNTEHSFGIPNVKRFKVRLKLVGCSATAQLALSISYNFLKPIHKPRVFNLMPLGLVSQQELAKSVSPSLTQCLHLESLPHSYAEQSMVTSYTIPVSIFVSSVISCTGINMCS